MKRGRRVLQQLRQSRLLYWTVELLAAALLIFCLLYTSDAADEEDSVDLGGRRLIKKKQQ